MRDPQDILKEILSIDENNLFLKYIVRRIVSNDYRGWHVSQHNRFDLEVMQSIIQMIYDVVGSNQFAIPPGDYSSKKSYKNYPDYLTIVSRINSEIGRGTFNSVKKNFFPDMEKMGFLDRNDRKRSGKLTRGAVNFIKKDILTNRYKKFTDAIDKLFGRKISDLAETIHLSEYVHDPISIYEFMFIFSDKNENVDKIKILDSYRDLKRKRNKVIDLISKYAAPKKFGGNKTNKRDFHNWKNQAQQIFNLLKTTVYFEVQGNDYFRLKGGNTGFFEYTVKRSSVPKNDYFKFHNVEKRNRFELHHIIPISHARNKEEAKIIDDYRNLIYLRRGSHKKITRAGNKHVILNMTSTEATFSGFDEIKPIRTKNEVDALYTRDQKKINKVSKHNAGLLRSIYEFEIPHPTIQRKP